MTQIENPTCVSDKGVSMKSLVVWLVTFRVCCIDICHCELNKKLSYISWSCIKVCSQWRNEAPGAPATPGGAVIGGRQIVIKMWDNFARLTALLAKVRVCFNNSIINLDFSAIFSESAPR